jgi:hypothetical protein
MSGSIRATHLLVTDYVTACGINPESLKVAKVTFNVEQANCNFCVKQEKTMSGLGKLKCLTCGKPYRDHKDFNDHAT